MNDSLSNKKGFKKEEEEEEEKEEKRRKIRRIRKKKRIRFTVTSFVQYLNNTRISDQPTVAIGDADSRAELSAGFLLHFPVIV